MKTCETVEESLDSLLEAMKQYSKKCGKNFYADFHAYDIVRYLKLVKRKARFHYQYKILPEIVWDVEKIEETS